MGLLKPLTGSAGYLKAGFLGFQGSGKTRTAVELAIGTRAFFGMTEPIGFFDTESGSDYVRELILKRTGTLPLGIKSQSFADLMEAAEESIGSVSVLIVDSVTHVWRELCESYLAQVNERLQRWAEKERRKFFPRQKMEFQDWGAVKASWQRWTNFYLNAPLHIVVCGRAGYEYDFQESDDDQKGKKKELVKTGIKMKTEGEFGYEPSLLVEMERVQRFDGDHTYLHQATVIKDKFDNGLDGKQMENPTFDFFRPHIARLKPDDHQPIDTSLKTNHGVDGDGDDDWHREKRARTIAAEEIQGELVRSYPGQTAAEKEAKMELLERVFGTRSWTRISEATHSGTLKKGLTELRAILRPAPADSSGEVATPPSVTPPAPREAAAEAELAIPPGQVETAAVPAGEIPGKPKRRNGKRSEPPAEAQPVPLADTQTALPARSRADDMYGPHPTDPVPDEDRKEIEKTIDALHEHPEWIPGVEIRIGALGDGMTKVKLWHRFVDKRAAIARANVTKAGGPT